MARQDRNPYEVLGLDADATSDEIKAAYRRLAKKHHPDKNQGDKTSEWIFKEVNRAYAALRDTSDGNRSPRRYGARRERQEHERAEREGRERDDGTRERARREQQAGEDRRRREEFVEESERRWARAEQERQRRKQQHEDEETLRKRWKQFWLVVMPLLLLFFIAYDDEETDLEARMVVWVGLGLFGLMIWLVQHVARAFRNSVSPPPNTCRVTYCESCSRIGRRRFTNDRSQCLHCKGGPIVTRVCASEPAAEDFIAEFRRRHPVRDGSGGRR